MVSAPETNEATVKVIVTVWSNLLYQASLEGLSVTILRAMQAAL